MRLLLSAPREIIQLSTLIPSLQLALRMGLSYTPLAVIAVDGKVFNLFLYDKFLFQALEYWIGQEPQEVVKFLPQVLPGFSDYLFETADADLMYDLSAEKDQLQAAIRTKQASSKAKANSKKKAGYYKSANQDAAEVALDLPTLRIRILRLLGRLGGHNKSVMARLGVLETDGRTGLAWDSERLFKYSMKLPDLNFDMNFGTTKKSLAN